MLTQPRILLPVVRLLMLAAAVTTLGAAEVRGQSGVIESWRASAGNWSGKRQVLDPAGNLLVVGDTNVGDIIQVRKYSPTGELLWSSIYDPPERVISYWIATDPAGNAWIAAARITGSRNSRVGFLVLKYDPQGELVFEDVTNGGLAVRVVTDAAGNGYVIGNGWSGAGTLADNYMVAKYAPDGRRLWTGFMESGSTTFLAGPTSLALSPDRTRLVVAGGVRSAFFSLSVAMYDTSNGQRLWNHVDNGKFGASDVAFAPDGASVYVGNTDFPQGSGNAMSLHKFDLLGNRIFSRSYPVGSAVIRLTVDGAGNVIATGTASPLPDSGYRDWMTIKTDAGGALLWARRYNATNTNDEVPGWVTVDSDDAVYVAGMGGPSPTTGNVSFLKPVTLKYDSAGTPVWVILDGGDAQVSVDAEGSVFTLDTNQMISARLEQTGVSDPVPAAPTAPANLAASSSTRRKIDLTWINTATNATSITVERCSGSTCTGFAAVAQLAATATSWTDSGVTSRSRYRYRLRSSNAAGSSPYSNVASALAR